jgi:hypothetical protein
VFCRYISLYFDSILLQHLVESATLSLLSLLSLVYSHPFVSSTTSYYGHTWYVIVTGIYYSPILFIHPVSPGSGFPRLFSARSGHTESHYSICLLPLRYSYLLYVTFCPMMDPYVVYERHSHNTMNHESPFQQDDFDFQQPQLSERRVTGTLLFNDAGMYLAPQSGVTSPMTRYIHDFDSYPPEPSVWYNSGHIHPSLHNDSRFQSSGAPHNSFPTSPRYPHHDPDDSESQSSGTRSQSIANIDDLPSPNGLSQPYWAPQHPSHWNTGYTAPLPFNSSQLLHTGGSFVAPTQVEHTPVPVPAASHHDEIMSDVDAEGEDDTTLLAAEDAPQRWSSVPDQPTPESRDSHTGPSSDDDGIGSDNESEYQPTRHRRKSSNGKRPSTTTRSGRKISRPQHLSAPLAKSSDRTSPGRLSKTRNNSWTKKGAAADGSTRPFYCPLAPYGCSSTFPNKNEWKRHTITQHLKQGLWRCLLCLGDGSGTFNEFNRKDLFVQHIQRMHRESLELDLNELAPHIRSQLQKDVLEDDIKKQFHKGKDRVKDEYWIRTSVLHDYDSECWLQLRNLPQSCTCPICNSKEFHGANAWEERMEHMAGHFERIRRGSNVVDNKHKPNQWQEDVKLRTYLEEEGLIERDSIGAWKLGDGTPKR